MPHTSKCLPRHAVHLKTYSELQRYAQAFAASHLRSLVLIGPPGVGKSAIFRAAVGDSCCWIGGNASPFGIYMAAYAHLDHPLILDDVDDLYRHPQGVRLLKALCQTDPIRTVSWQSQARALVERGIPHEFRTSSPVAIIANDWQTIGPNVAAIEDRVHLLVFDPSPVEIHRQAATWFWDQLIFDFVADHLTTLECHSFRVYVRAWELKSAEMDWRAVVLANAYSGTARIVAQLKSDPSFTTEEERVRAFVEGDHGCRATYFNHSKLLKPISDVPRLELIRTEPPAASTVEATGDILKWLQRGRQFGCG